MVDGDFLPTAGTVDWFLGANQDKSKSKEPLTSRILSTFLVVCLKSW